MSFQPADRLFIDESKARGYYIAVTAAHQESTPMLDKALRALLKPGQRRLHFKSERDSRRREILSRMCELDLRVSVWVTRGRPNKEARDLCLESVVIEACRSGASMLIIERDDSLVTADRSLIATVLRAELSPEIEYVHALPYEHPLLWVSDAVAWCHSSGGDWVRRVAPLVEGRLIRL